MHETLEPVFARGSLADDVLDGPPVVALHSSAQRVCQHLFGEATRELVAAYEKRLADAREEARRLQREQTEADSAKAAQRLAELGQKLNARIDEAEKRIAGQRGQVMQGIEQMATDIAADVYAKLAGQPADRSALGTKVAAAKGSH